MAPSKSKSKEPSEADIIFTRASVALAKSQRLIASWLPPKSEAEIAHEKELGNDRDGEDSDGDLEDGRRKGSELLGVGATLPSLDATGAGSILRRKDASLDTLRTQLLGRHAAKRGGGSNAAHHVASTPRPSNGVSGGPTQTPLKRVGARDADNDEDGNEDEGRSAMFSSKLLKGSHDPSRISSANTKTVSIEKGENLGAGFTMININEPKAEEAPDDGAVVEVVSQAKDVQQSSRPAKRKPMSYLDEELARKSAKKKMKQTNKKG